MDMDVKMDDGEETGEEKNNQLAVCQDIPVKSTAVVKYSNLEMPALYHELQPNTNLNEAPANWLHGQSKLESYLRDLSLTRDKSFSSFKIAHCFPEQAGDVDVISDGENIKKLLKMPYSKGQVSMIVHRVGSTLLLDDFDIHKHLLRQQQSDWSWLREFYQNVILQSMEQAVKDKLVVKKNKSRESLQNRDMFSKFLYHSVTGHENEDQGLDSSAFPGLSPQDARVETLENQTIPDPFSQPRLDQSDHQRTVMWTFEDLRMLIGTDLPIFGGSSHPCVSLRLRDMRKPINVLTGLDYWLDNLMCNVPELAMCYHLDGIVQSYELLKTEDIPNLEDANFAPKVVKDIAQNILSFLKANATKEGHTYWLFKGHGDDVVKLYDLTTLMEDYHSSEQNPFKVPVGLLLYRVARNMRQNSGRQKSGTIKILLENCLLLLDQDAHSQVVTSAHYLLSDLYMSDNIYDQNLPPPDESESESDMDDDPSTPPDIEEVEEEEEEGTTEDEIPSVSMDVEALRMPQTEKRLRQNAHVPITGPVEDRSLVALQHIAEGLHCLDKNVTMKVEETREKHKVETQETADPNTAIPLHYASLDPSWVPNMNSYSSTSSGPPSPNQISVIKRSTLPTGTWHTLSKTLLLKKAAVVYLALAEKDAANGMYGHSLRNARLALLCFCGMQYLMPSKLSENCHILVALLGVAGDVHLMMAHNQDKCSTIEEEYNSVLSYDTIIQESVERDLSEFEYSWMNQITVVVMHNLQRSILCYEAAIEAVTVNKNLNIDLSNEPYIKRLGNVRNELGVQYMNHAANIISEGGAKSPSDTIQDLWQRSFACFISGIQAFECLKDKLNMALLHSNCGRLMRLCARAYASYDDTGQHTEMVVQEKHYYAKAVDEYQQTLSLLKQAETHTQASEIVNSVTWELSSTYFTWAKTLQDHAPLSSTAQEQVEKEVTELMTKALKYCDTNSESPRQGTCQYRAATIHHRLGSLYHNAYRNQLNDQKKKHQRSLADLHYEKASHFFALCDSPCEMLRVQLERVAMCEYQLARQTSPVKKLKTLQSSLSHLMYCRQPLMFVYSQLTDPREQEGSEVLQMYQDELNKLLTLLDERLKFTLLNMVRNAIQPRKSKTSANNQLDSYKAVYASVIKKQSSTGETDLAKRCLSLHRTLEEVAAACDPKPTGAQSNT